jgi:hypothetical protein
MRDKSLNVMSKGKNIPIIYSENIACCLEKANYIEVDTTEKCTFRIP